MARIETIKLSIALARLVELGELELRCPACPDPPPSFHHGLAEAVKTTKVFLAETREAPGEWFYSAEGRVKGKQSKLLSSS